MRIRILEKVREKGSWFQLTILNGKITPNYDNFLFADSTLGGGGVNLKINAL